MTFYTKQRNKIIWNLDPFWLLERNSSVFVWVGMDLISKAVFIFGQNFPWLFNVTKWNSCQTFWIKKFTFQTKQTNKMWNFARFLTIQNKLIKFLGGWFRKQVSDFAQTLHDPSVSQNNTSLKVILFRQFTFQTKRNKICHLDSFHLLGTNWQSFGVLIWKAAFSVSPKFAWRFSITK